MKTSRFTIRAYKVKELALIYRVSKPTFRKWLKPFRHEIGTQIGHFYTYKQVKLIVERLGLPDLALD